MLKYENRENEEKMKTKLIKKIMALTIATITVIGMPAVGASASWRQNNNGWWNSKGNDYSVGWDRIGDNWFYFNQNGYMKTGWLKDGDKWYFLNQKGDMKTGWLQDGDKWYYLNENGDMLYNAFIAGYRLGSDGAWIDDNLHNVTTGAAVNIITDPTVNTTTGSAVTLQNDYDKYLDKSNKQKDKLENLMDKYNKKLDEQAQKIEKKVNNAWQFFYR